MSKNADFFETCFSQKNEVGLRMYTDFVIAKNGLAWFQWELTCFALKMEFFWKSGKVRRTWWFVRFRSNWPVKRTCIHQYTHMWLMCIHSWGKWVVFLSFWFNCLSCFKVVKYETNLVENNLWVRLPWKSFMTSLLWINEDVWIIDRCWIWCLSWWGVFSLLLELWEFHEVVELLWWWCWWIIYVSVHICCWWIFLHASVGEIIGECMYFYSRWNCGEYMHSWLSHMFTHHMLSRMFTSILPLTGYLYPYSRWQWCLVGIRGDDLEGDSVPHVSRVSLDTLHV